MGGDGGGSEEEREGALRLVAAFAVGVEEGGGWGGRAERVRGWFVVDGYDAGPEVKGEVPDFEAELGVELREEMEGCEGGRGGRGGRGGSGGIDG